MVDFNDRLLRQLDGTWFCPPLLGPAEVSLMLGRHASGALAALKDAHPERPFVWKDPRTCVLLPFWSAVLGQRVAYVLVVRHPLEVSDSLARRNGCTPLLSLALWERLLSDVLCAFNREVLLAAGGVDKGFSSASAAVAELSLRLWRMGFRCGIIPHVDVWRETSDGDYADDDAARLSDRLRIATLHFSPPRLKAFTDRASRRPSYDSAAERLAASDVELRRAAIESVCAFPIDRYFESFPLPLTTLRSALRRTERLIVHRSRRWRIRAVDKMLKRARNPFAQRVRFK